MYRDAGVVVVVIIIVTFVVVSLMYVLIPTYTYDIMARECFSVTSITIVIIITIVVIVIIIIIIIIIMYSVWIVICDKKGRSERFGKSLLCILSYDNIRTEG